MGLGLLLLLHLCDHSGSLLVNAGGHVRRDRHAKHITAAKRRIEAMQLRQQGLSFKEIGERLGCSTQRAHGIVTEEFARLRAEQNELAENILRLANDRIETMIKVLWPKVAAGDRAAIETTNRLLDRQLRMFGVDAPRKEKDQSQVNVNVYTDPAALKARARMMGLDVTDLEENENGPLTSEQPSTNIRSTDGGTEEAAGQGSLPPGSQDRA